MRSALLMYIAAPICALSNEGAAGMAAGGIVFVKNSAVSMEREILEISPKQVKVTYLFRNATDSDQTVLIAFPLPETPWGLPYASQNKVEAFRAYANDEEISPSLEVKIVKDGRDIWRELRSVDVSIEFAADSADRSSGILVKESELDKFRSLQNAGLGRLEIGPLHSSFTPSWSVRRTYYWEQTFPANFVTKVLHTYEPAVWRENSGVGLGNAGAPERSTLDMFLVALGYWGRHNFRDDGCVGNAFFQRLRRATLRRAVKTDGRLQEFSHYGLEYVRYILTTANAWNGPIKDFELRLVKDKPSDLVTLCFPGKSTRSRDGALVFQQKNFTPERDLGVYFFSIPESKSRKGRGK